MPFKDAIAWRDYNARYREDHREEIRIKSQLYYRKRCEVAGRPARDYRARSEGSIALAVSQEIWARNNARKRATYLKRKGDPQYLLPKRLRTRLYVAIRNEYKSGSAVRDLGCTIAELKAYLESKFQPGMSWENWGTKGWHIDHIKPLAKFDLTDREQLLAAVHYTNLQPLWWQKNQEKGST